MWDVLNRHPRGRLSQRKLHVLATGLIVAVLLCAGVFAKIVSADAKDALLKDGALQYDSKTFAPQSDLKASDPRNFSEGTHVFGYSANGSNKVEYIFIDGGVTVDKATVGAYVTYTYTPPSTYADQSNPIQVNITHMTNDPTVATSNTCNGFGGMGWIFCPVVTSLSGAIDGIYNFITQFFDTPPLTSDSAIYKIWDAVRSIANIVFVIVFIIIIYSQVTSLGISKYGIRTMLPRLIVAAVLVNVSYWMCSLGIDLSNLLGHAVESFFMSYLATLQGTTVIPDWSTLTQALIGGGVAGGALIGGIWFSVATGGGPMALVFILLGMVVTVVLALLAALIILAARQAILIVFTLISPLAFVAMVLPSTEKLFDKWKDTMLAMLLLFPIFGLVYGGAQVAGAAIVLGSKGNIFLLLLGKFIIFIPLAITPLLVKFSSGVLSTVVGMVNDRKKGAIDRFRNWNNQQIDYHRRMSLGKVSKAQRLNPFRRTAQFFDSQKRIQDQALQGAEARATDLAQRRRKLLNYRNAYNSSQTGALMKDASESALKAQWDDRRRTNAKTMRYDTAAREAAGEAKYAADRLETIHAEIAAGNSANALRGVRGSSRHINAVRTSADRIRTTGIKIAATAMAKSQAERQEKENFAQELRDAAEGKISITIDGRGLHEYAGGIKGIDGINSAISQAKATASKYLLDDIKNIQDTMDYKESTNVKILHEKFTAAKTMAERVAYANAIAKNGGPGIGELRKVITEYESMPGLSQEDLFDFKELLGTNSSVMSAGKDIEFWITNSKQSDASGNFVLGPDGTPIVRTFNDLSNDVGTWKALSASAFARMNIVSQFHALQVMKDAADGSYEQYIDMLRQSTSKDELKSAVRKAHDI